MADMEEFACLACGSKAFAVGRRGGQGRGPRFWHVYCHNPACGIIIMDVRNDSGSVIPLLADKEPA